MLPIVQDFLSKERNRPALRNAAEYSIRALRGVIVHWTANTSPKADAKAHRTYFNNVTNRFASAHYVVDDKTIIQCIPDNEVGFHVGDNPTANRPDGLRLRGGSALTANYFVIGFEMCVNSDGDWNKTYKNSVELAAHLLRKYQFTTTDLYRHLDITGKACPQMMLQDTPWNAFKRDVDRAMADDPQIRIAQGRVTASELNVRSGPGTAFAVLGKLSQNQLTDVLEEQNGWLRVATGRWVSKSHVQTVFQTWLGRIDDRTGANVRTGAGTTFPVVDALANGVLVSVIGQNGDWLEIGANRWLNQRLVKTVAVRYGTVGGTTDLNVRIGPGTDSRIARSIPSGTKVRILDEQDGWFRLGVSEWVFGKFVVVNN